MCALAFTSDDRVSKHTIMANQSLFTAIFTFVATSGGYNVNGYPLHTKTSGDTVRLECNRSVEGTVDWKVEYDPKDITRYVCLRGRLLDKYKPRFELDSSNYTLTIHDVMVNDSGLYYCVDDEGFGQPHFSRLDVVLPAPHSVEVASRKVDELTLSWYQDGAVSGHIVSINGVHTTNVNYSHVGHAVTARIHRLAPGTGYNVSIWSTRGDALSRNATVVHCATVPAAPVQLRLVNRTERCLVVRWNQTGRVTGYKLTVDDSCPLNTEYTGVGTELVTARVCCLTTGMRHRLIVSAFNGDDQSQEISDYFETEPSPGDNASITVLILSASLVVAVLVIIILIVTVVRSQHAKTCTCTGHGPHQYENFDRPTLTRTTKY